MDCSLKFDYMNKELLVIVYHHGTVKINLQIGTNHSSGTERSVCNKFGYLLSLLLINSSAKF